MCDWEQLPNLNTFKKNLFEDIRKLPEYPGCIIPDSRKNGRTLLFPLSCVRIPKQHRVKRTSCWGKGPCRLSRFSTWLLISGAPCWVLEIIGKKKIKSVKRKIKTNPRKGKLGSVKEVLRLMNWAKLHQVPWSSGVELLPRRMALIIKWECGFRSVKGWGKRATQK